MPVPDGMNREWALAELRMFTNLTERSGETMFSTLNTEVGRDEDIIASSQVADHILDLVVPDWRVEDVAPVSAYDSPWLVRRRWALRAVTEISRDQEIRQNLGDTAPQLVASHLHPWVWDAARSSWQAGFYRHAVTDALMRINLETQRKSGRTELSEGDLFVQVFSKDDPKPEAPRLRLVDKSNPKTFQSVHRGVASFAEGLYAAVRNPLSHAEQEISEDQALEYLAAMSVLARWVHDAKVERAGG